MTVKTHIVLGLKKDLEIIKKKKLGESSLFLSYKVLNKTFLHLKMCWNFIYLSVRIYHKQQKSVVVLLYVN
jgi:hypothetical protein